MKKNGFLAIIAMAALSFAACNKEGLPQNDATDLPSDEPVVETPVVLEPGVYPATIVAEPIMPDLAGTKAVFDSGAFKWEAGDAIACFQHFEEHAETNVITTMTTAAGDGNFAGSLPYTESDTYQMNFIHPASVAIKLVGVGTSEQLEINLPNEQDGRLEYLGNYFIAGKAKVSCVVNDDDPDNISITAENVELNKYPVFAVKVDVPEAYNAQSIKIEALRNNGTTVTGLAGKSYLNVNNRQHKGPQTYPSAQHLTISHNDDSQISGDTYGVMMPYGKDKGEPCTVNKIKFTVTTSSSQTYTFAKSVSALNRGTIYDLGTFPTSCVTPKFSFDENGAVVMTSSPAEAKIYYTTDGSDPSAAEEFLYQGPVGITADTHFKAVAICEGLGNSAVAEYTASFNVSAPEIVVTSTGEISVNPVSGLTYMYSMTTDGSIPGEPDTELDVETGINILNKGTGTYKIRISATNAFANTAETKAQYRIYYQKDVTTASVSIEPLATNTEAFAPFVVNNYHESATLNLTISNSNYWKFDKTTSASSQQNVYIGVYTEYESNMSFHTYLNANKKTYTRYGGEKGVGPNGVTNYAALDSKGNPVHAAKTWNSWWTAGPVETGKLVGFSAAYDTRVQGWAVLEQGFDSFNPAAASVSNEAPVSGQNVAY